jgi:hypothetical protein
LYKFIIQINFGKVFVFKTTPMQQNFVGADMNTNDTTETLNYLEMDEIYCSQLVNNDLPTD